MSKFDKKESGQEYKSCPQYAVLQKKIYNSANLWYDEKKQRSVLHDQIKMPSQPPTETKSVRYPVTLIEAIEKAIRGTDCTFSAFVVADAWFALENLEEEKTSKEENL